jgi:hypothetical protein
VQSHTFQCMTSCSAQSQLDVVRERTSIDLEQSCITGRELRRWEEPS